MKMTINQPQDEVVTNTTIIVNRETPFLVSLIAGGLAGTSVDVTLFPIDTIKTRIQSPQGLLKAGGFRGVYNGLGAAAIGSAPGAALFFTVYEGFKVRIESWQRHYDILPNSSILTHMMAASLGEAAACIVRVPTEVVKQNMQTSFLTASTSTAMNASMSTTEAATMNNTISQTVRKILHQEGNFIFGGLYRGYGITLMREVPFALIQFPIYERMKMEWAKIQSIDQVSPAQAALCGSISGGIAAALTTPLDVIKTRLMLGQDKHGKPYTSARDVVRRIAKEEGTRTFFSGIEPRVMWISIGGFVFFGAYEQFRSIFLPILS